MHVYIIIYDHHEVIILSELIDSLNVVIINVVIIS